MKELLYCWFPTRLDVLVPKRRGNGFVKVPWGHHQDPGLTDIERAAGCDVFGLDGCLMFECGIRVATYEASRKAFEDVVLPALQRHYGWPCRKVTSSEYWRLNPSGR